MIKLRIDQSKIQHDNYIDSCLVVLGVIEEINNQLNTEDPVITPEQFLKATVRAKSEINFLSLLDKQQILKDNENQIVWST